MYVIRLPNGVLRVPESALSPDGEVVADGYVEVGPGDPDYERLAVQALTEQELAERRRRWQDEDQALYQEFLAFKAQQDQVN